MTYFSKEIYDRKKDYAYRISKRGNILVRTATSNPHLYDWADIDFVFEIRIGALVYDTVRA